MVKRFLVVIVLGVVVAGASGALEAGAAKTEITPELGTPLAGYYQRMGRGAVAIHDPLYVRALYLDDGDTRVFLVSADLCVISPDLRQAVLERAPKEVPRENIILTATHTMSGPGGIVQPLIFRLLTGRYMPGLIDSMAERFADAMRMAYDNRKRATIGFAASTTENLSRNAMVNDGPVDPQLGVLRVNDSDGEALAILGNFGARCVGPQVPGPEMLTLSADYPGFFCTALEELAGQECVAMFLQGACGDVKCAVPGGDRDWAQAEAIGKALAGRVFETAQKIESGDVPIEVARGTVELPPTLANAWLPSTTTLASLEIGGLAMTFIPGEPCAQISLDLRAKCLEREYTHQFTVSMANDYAFFFVPKSQYALPGHETTLCFYGPTMGDWFCTEFSRLLSRGAADVLAVSDQQPEVTEQGGVRKIVLRGGPYQLGYSHGAAFQKALAEEFEQRYAGPAASGAVLPGEPPWAVLPDFVQPYLETSNVTVPWLAMGARPMLEGLPDFLFSEVVGVAAGGGMPFDAAWLVQCGPMIEAREGLGELYRAPFCTMFAAVGLKAGADDILIARNLDWSEPVTPVVYDVRPDEGYRYLMVGFPWSVGGFSGINENGVVVCVERNETLGMPALKGPPVEFAVANILRRARSAWVALEMIDLFPHLQGYHILLGDPNVGSEGLPPVRVVQLGGTPRLRGPSDGILLGANPEAEQLDDAARARYERVATLVADERNLNPSELEEILSDAQAASMQNSSIFNARTRYSVVFEPKARRMRVALPVTEGAPGEFVRFEFEEETQTPDADGSPEANDGGAP